MLALLPLWLALFGWTDEVVYRISSVVACLYIGTFVCVMAWTGRRLTRSGHPPRVRYFPFAVALLLGASAVVAGAGAAGWLQGSVVPAYVGCLIALLLASAMVLAVFLVLLARMTQRKA